MLRAESVTVLRGGRRILDELTLTLEPGELLAVIGPNGAGKSTLLSVLAGELEPSAGAVWLDDRLLEDWPRAERARRLGVLPQESRLAFGFTAHEVAMLGRAPHFPESEHRAHTIAARALDLTGVAHLAERSYPTLSGGERQRVQLARVLTQLSGAPKSPRVLLLDEPTASLDLGHQLDTLELAQELAREGAAVLAVLHDLNLAARYADRIALIDAGRLVACGPTAEVLQPERILSVFGALVSVVKHPTRSHPVVIAD
jgi:iron complex transport system ATP-binding protein